MILMHDRTYRNRLNQIKHLQDEVDFLRNRNEILNDEKKDLIFQIEYYERLNKVLRKKIKEYEK